VAKKDRESKVFPFTSISPTPWTQLNQSLTSHSFIIKTIPWVKPTIVLILQKEIYESKGVKSLQSFSLEYASIDIVWQNKPCRLLDSKNTTKHKTLTLHGGQTTPKDVMHSLNNRYNKS
jgi:hypothetical protein